MTTKPTPKHIEAAIKDLKDIRPLIRPVSFFGDNNLAALDAQVKVLEKGLSEDRIYDNWPDDDETHHRSAALDARTWLDGEVNQDSDKWIPTALVDMWKPLARKV